MVFWFHWKSHIASSNDDLEICYEKILEIMMSEKNGIKKDQDVDIIQKKIDELTK